MKHRWLEQFSESPVVFAVLAVGASKKTVDGPEGTEGFVRHPMAEVHDEELRPSFEFLGIDRALLLREACTTALCLQKDARLRCNAAELNLTALYDKKTGIHTNLCEMQ